MSTPLAQFAALLDRLERRAGMYLHPVSYETLIAYLSGYDGAKVESGAPSIVEAFREWLHGRVGHHCSMHWAAVVREEFAGGDSNRAVPQLFGLFREFIRDTRARPGEATSPGATEKQGATREGTDPGIPRLTSEGVGNRSDSERTEPPAERLAQSRRHVPGQRVHARRR